MGENLSEKPFLKFTPLDDRAIRAYLCRAPLKFQCLPSLETSSNVLENDSSKSSVNSVVQPSAANKHTNRQIQNENIHSTSKSKQSRKAQVIKQIKGQPKISSFPIPSKLTGWVGDSRLRPRPRPRKFIQLNLAASKLTINLMLKINTQNTVNRAYIWLKLVSVVIDNICTVRILYRDLSDSPFSGTI